MAINLKPLANNVIVEPSEQEETTALGIVLPETAKEKPQKGTVLAVGPGRRLEGGEREEMQVSEGDVVVYARYAGTTVEVGGNEVIVLKEDDILAVEA